jgi:hypothetical protein
MITWNFFYILKVEKVPKMHWSDANEWGMVDHMHNVILEMIKYVVQKAKIFSFNCDEVMIFYN